ncbi:RNA polymerase factor sigma-54 [Heliophilum fasciatum]|uniref:RNA polymerase RpoN-/SigL-like sigma 54 subunit n=1 Tax=Heliophilum fasciatum TaxID=35700 RepID=A0A4R2RRH0_9FIRM|nr:RNA polymerase factor sigma-54 [Heliophilum fasciatum]MCW2277710.1 RNA polymerase sigma-54 factor [Heliophilum fasciatum]TCP65057.1 RNA polymerase RpoN-/SigL-like sigma 54 subunit [Heliophilum fasciatum]
MSFGFGLALEQSQKLMITQGLRQALAVLQMNTQELIGHVEQELLVNPLLEQDPLPPSDAPEPDFFPVDGAFRGMTGWREVAEAPDYENVITEEPSLFDFLTTQLHIAVPNGRECRIGEYLIGNIDDNGYLQCSISEATAALHVCEEEVARVLQIVQTFEPAGVGARSLAECLRIQFDQLGMLNPDLETFLHDHLEDLAAGRMTVIAKKLRLPVSEVQALAEAIRQMEPRPGRRFSRAGDVRMQRLDVMIERVAGEYVILVNDRDIPRIAVNSAYRSIYREAGKDDPDTKKYMEERYQAALGLIRSIEQRRLTLYKVVQTLVELQRDFFEQGLHALKPLNLLHVAERIGVHESTVSRAVANKWAATPWGTFELKMFFGSGVGQHCGGDMVAAESVKRTIREIVATEDTRQPLSDQRIAEQLQAQGINISRRTVAKYRDELGILGSTQRRR